MIVQTLKNKRKKKKDVKLLNEEEKEHHMPQCILGVSERAFLDSAAMSPPVLIFTPSVEDSQSSTRLLA